MSDNSAIRVSRPNCAGCGALITNDPFLLILRSANLRLMLCQECRAALIEVLDIVPQGRPS